MSMIGKNEKQHDEEIEHKAMKGMPCLVMNVAALLVFVAAFIIGAVMASAEENMVAAVLLRSRGEADHER